MKFKITLARRRETILHGDHFDDVCVCYWMVSF
jgi:hypothetical protein